MKSSTHKREASGGSSDEEWWSDLIPVPFDTEQLAFPFNRAGKVEWHYYPTHPFKDNQGSARGIQASIRWPRVSRRCPLLLADIRIIEEAVGAERYDDIKAFLIHQCHLTGAQVNELSWDEIVAHCRVYLKPTQNQAGEKLEHAALAKQRAKTGRDAKVTIGAIIISLLVACIFEVLVWLVPVTPFSWVKNHPNSYGLQPAIVLVVPCIFVGVLKRQYRKWCVATGVTLLVLILSLLGGRTRS